MEYAFNLYNRYAADGVTSAVGNFLARPPKKRGAKRTDEQLPPDLDGVNEPPVVVCVGSDLAIGDSLGPIVGSLLRYKTQGVNAFVYGTLSSPVTAKEVRYMHAFLKETHPNRRVVAVDAAVGAEGDIGLIKLRDEPLYPGSGANKKLGALGDCSILGVVAEKSEMNYGLLNTTRLNLVCSMAEAIADGLASLLWEIDGRKKRRLQA